MKRYYTDQRVSDSYTKVATVGSNSHQMGLPPAKIGEIEIRDLRVSMANSTAARGLVRAYVYEYDQALTTVSRITDTVIAEIQIGRTGGYITGFLSGLVVTTTCAIAFSFANCVASDELEMYISYTIRRYQ